MRYKYSRTYHFDFSLGLTTDDKLISTLDNFIDKEVVVTIKMDGENSSLYSDFYHARSLDSSNHESRSWLKQFHSEISYLIPEGYRICGENMFAKHSIFYDNLESYFYCFNIWDENNNCLSWDETKEYCELLKLKLVDTVYEGKFDYNKIKEIYNNLDFNKIEGIVVRLKDSFSYKDFSTCVCKAVRSNHVQTDKHWMNQKIIKNLLK